MRRLPIRLVRVGRECAGRGAARGVRLAAAAELVVDVARRRGAGWRWRWWRRHGHDGTPAATGAGIDGAAAAVEKVPTSVRRSRRLGGHDLAATAAAEDDMATVRCGNHHRVDVVCRGGTAEAAAGGATGDDRRLQGQRRRGGHLLQQVRGRGRRQPRRRDMFDFISFFSYFKSASTESGVLHPEEPLQ